MSQSPRRRGFTLIELLVVVAIIALLIAILIPSLQAAREQGKRAKCLSNLRAIATGMHSYSSDDKRSQSFPVQPVYGNDALTGNSFSFIEYLFVTWWTWGGRDGVVPWNLGTAAYYVRAYNRDFPPSLESNPSHWKTYSAANRPLNSTLYPRGITSTGEDRFDLPIFECPSDTGYPLNSPSVGEEVDDAPPTARRIRCYDGLGNSYRASFSSISTRTGRNVLTTGPAAHRLDTIPTTSETIWFGDPLFFNMIGSNNALGTANATLYFVGWHRRRGAENLAFVDGSARFTEVGTRIPFDRATLDQMNVSPSRSIAARGPGYRLDVYPTAGAVLMKPVNSNLGWVSSLAGGLNTWPGRGYQYNFDTP
jgi:prepilin-type N-terminal cleavage/methylation domain-containing protein